MKNIHVLPTDKPSIICKLDNVLVLSKIGTLTNDTKSLIRQNIYITSDEEIKEGVEQWYLDKVLNEPYNSGGAQYSSKQDVIILTTDQELIKDGVQSIDDEFLEWFVKNPSCEFVEVEESNLLNTSRTYLGVDKYKIIIPKEVPKQETLEEVKKYLSNEGYGKGTNFTLNNVANLMLEWQQEQDKNKYSEEDMIAFGKSCFYKGFEKAENDDANCYTAFREEIGSLFQQFKNK
jgi:hypothetical protein